MIRLQIVLINIFDSRIERKYELIIGTIIICFSFLDYFNGRKNCN